MVNVLDTHRLQYRNAVLRAYDAANPTTRIDFFNGDVNIGNEVYTNENGYLFYEAGGRQPIENLNVDGSAIIKVSLDGGNSFEITWQVDDKTSQYVEESDVHDMTYRGSDNTRKTWHPLQADCALPDYLLKSEYHDGIWGEQEMAIGAGTGSVILNEWTHVITILSTAPDAIAFTNVRLRAGQVITIKAAKDCTLNLIVGHGPGINHNVYKDCTYLLFNMYATESSDAGLTLTQIATPTMYVFNKTGDDLYSDDGDTTVKVDINIEAPVGCYPMIVNVVANETKAAWASKSLYVNFINGNGNQVVSTGHTINGTSPYAVASTNFGQIWREGDTYRCKFD